MSCSAGHVRLNRMDKRSQLNCLKECGRLLGLGCSVLFFPEGTRTTDGKMAAFKKVRLCFKCTKSAACINFFCADLHCTSLQCSKLSIVLPGFIGIVCQNLVFVLCFCLHS